MFFMPIVMGLAGEGFAIDAPANIDIDGLDMQLRLEDITVSKNLPIKPRAPRKRPPPNALPDIVQPAANPYDVHFDLDGDDVALHDIGDELANGDDIVLGGEKEDAQQAEEIDEDYRAQAKRHNPGDLENAVIPCGAGSAGPDEVTEALPDDDVVDAVPSVKLAAVLKKSGASAEPVVVEPEEMQIDIEFANAITTMIRVSSKK